MAARHEQSEAEMKTVRSIDRDTSADEAMAILKEDGAVD